MGIFISLEEQKRLKNAPQSSRQQEFYRALKSRVEKNTKEDTLVQSGDSQEWYHLCWERFSDVSFVCSMEKDEKLGKWLYNRTMELVRMDVDKWVGPWYREKYEILQGFLETAHITLAVCEAIDNCTFLFSEAEQKEILQAIREKGMILCMRYCESIIAAQDHINNWFMVTLDGFGTAAAILQDDEMIKKAIQWSHVAGSLYNANDYGESVQYSNYATLHLSHLNEILLRSGYAKENELDLNCYTNIMDWYATSFLYMKPLQQDGDIIPRTINFGDSAAIFRPSGDVLAHVAVRMKHESPRQAKIAAWMLEHMYPDPSLEPDELASFGLFNQFQYHTILMMPDMVGTASPETVGLPTSNQFEGGHIISRDQWEGTRAVVAIQAGYQPYNVTSHRHKDQNSFQLVIGKERMLIDPGHCCYRLNAQKEAISELAHNTISIKKDGLVVEQKEVKGNVFKRKEVGNNLICNYFWGSVQIVASDIANLYDDTIQKAVRIWVMELPHKMFVIDVVTAKEPVSLCTHFCVNNRDNKLQVNKASDQRLVIRRGGQALKLFEAYSETDGQGRHSKYSCDWTAMHTYYHPLPNQEGQGKEGSVNRYLWEGEKGREHIRIHTLVMDASQEIVGWHVYHMEDGFTRIESPCKKHCIEVKVQNNKLVIRNEKMEEEIINY